MCLLTLCGDCSPRRPSHAAAVAKAVWAEGAGVSIGCFRATVGQGRFCPLLGCACRKV
jgi:hypothetical protein